MMACIAFVTAISLATPSGRARDNGSPCADTRGDSRLPRAYTAAASRRRMVPYAYLACLEQNRVRLTTRCVSLSARYGR